MSLFPTASRSPELPGMDMSIVILAPAESQLTTKAPPKIQPPALTSQKSRIKQAPPRNRPQIAQKRIFTHQDSSSGSKIKPRSTRTAEPPDRRKETRQKFLEPGRNFWNRSGTGGGDY
uniref:Uncharacterized protein n=1 Tax=Arundo donax TaxID=35708 RepID=A0A0A9GCC6_ARUDO